MEDRIERLESLVALQEQTIEGLSDALYEQEKRVADLEKNLGRLAGRVKELNAALEQGGDEGPEPPPPHYGSTV